MSHDQIEELKVETPTVAYEEPTKPLTRAERDELNMLSQALFGTSSRWQKLVNKGYTEDVSEEVDEILPGEEGQPDTIRKARIAVKTKGGTPHRVSKRHTYASVKEFMVASLVQLRKMQEQYNKMQAEAKADKEAKELAAQVQDVAGGSAV